MFTEVSAVLSVTAQEGTYDIAHRIEQNQCSDIGPELAIAIHDMKDASEGDSAAPDDFSF